MIDRITDKSRLEIHARWMLNNQTIESRRKWIEEYRRKNGPVASVELKQALTQEFHKLKSMSDVEKQAQLVADDISQKTTLHTDQS